MTILGNNQFSRFISWHDQKHGCRGKWQRSICIFSIFDLPLVASRDQFIANKFSLGYDPLAYQCMEEWLADKVVKKPSINMYNYCKLKNKYSNLVNCPKYL